MFTDKISNYAVARFPRFSDDPRFYMDSLEPNYLGYVSNVFLVNNMYVRFIRNLIFETVMALDIYRSVVVSYY